MPFIFVIICFTEVCRKCGIFINIKSNGGNGNEGYNWGKSSIRKAANQWKEALLKMRAGGPSDKAEGIAHMKALKSLAL